MVVQSRLPIKRLRERKNDGCARVLPCTAERCENGNILTSKQLCNGTELNVNFLLTAIVPVLVSAQPGKSQITVQFVEGSKWAQFSHYMIVKVLMSIKRNKTMHAISITHYPCTKC